MAQIQSLAQEFPYATDAVKKQTKKLPPRNSDTSPENEYGPKYIFLPLVEKKNGKKNH